MAISSARSGASEGRSGEDALTGLESEIQHLASAQLELRGVASGSRQLETQEHIFERAAALRDNAMGIIYDGDGSTDTERVGRLLALIPALLTVVDEARDTISRLRELADEPDAPRAANPYDVPGRARPERPNWPAAEEA